MSSMPLGVMIGVGKVMAGKLPGLREAGFTTLQTSTPPAEYHRDPQLAALKQTIAEAGFTVTSLAAVYAGESYADVDAVRRTVGLLPPATRAERTEDTKRCSDFAHALGAANVSSHIGYIPEDRSDPDYRALVATLQDICDSLQRHGQSFNLETGQEAAEALRTFIGDVNRPNLGVNFDPANMILYGTGDPIEALGILAPWVRGVHCKDGDWPTAAGQLGQEQRLGDGQVGLDRFLAKLVEIGYTGPLTVEREVPGDQQLTDFVYAAGLLKGIKAKLGVD
jgi:sugar phosphate isomerase/epimerase